MSPSGTQGVQHGCAPGRRVLALLCLTLPSSSERVHQFPAAWMSQSRELFCALSLGGHSGRGCRRIKQAARSWGGKHKGEVEAS